MSFHVVFFCALFVINATFREATQLICYLYVKSAEGH